ncbi:MAG: hypothetical protein Q8Q50_09235 [Methylobacter sp.]|nr:hypothetical protein [Methylobacter sp.]
MNESNQYDGTGKLAEAIADLCGLSPKSQGQIAKLIKQAKDALKITSKAKVMPTDTKLAIWRWHYDRLHPAGESVEIISQLPGNEPVEIFSQLPDNDAVEIIAQSVQVEPVEIISQPEDEPEVNNLDVIRIAFYANKDGKRTRQVIALDGFYLNGLIAATGITRQDVPKWIQAAVDGWIAFDAHLPITRQVKYLIVRTMTEALNAYGRAD